MTPQCLCSECSSLSSLCSLFHTKFILESQKDTLRFHLQMPVLSKNKNLPSFPESLHGVLAGRNYNYWHNPPNYSIIVELILIDRYLNDYKF